MVVMKCPNCNKIIDDVLHEFTTITHPSESYMNENGLIVLSSGLLELTGDYYKCPECGHEKLIR